MSSSSLIEHPFVQVFREWRVEDRKRSRRVGDVKRLVDPRISKVVYRLRGAVSSDNRIEVPNMTPVRKPKSGEATLGTTTTADRGPRASLNLHGRFAYITLQPISGRHFVVHLDVVTRTGRVLRLSIGSIFRRFRVRVGRVAEIPVRVGESWGIIALDLWRLTAAVERSSDESACLRLLGVGGAKKFGAIVKDDVEVSFSSLKAVTVCSSLVVRGVTTSDHIFGPNSLPKELDLPRPASIRFTDDFFFLWVPAAPWVRRASRFARGGVKKRRKSSDAEESLVFEGSPTKEALEEEGRAVAAIAHTLTPWDPSPESDDAVERRRRWRRGSMMETEAISAKLAQEDDEEGGDGSGEGSGEGEGVVMKEESSPPLPSSPLHKSVLESEAGEESPLGTRPVLEGAVSMAHLSAPNAGVSQRRIEEGPHIEGHAQRRAKELPERHVQGTDLSSSAAADTFARVLPKSTRTTHPQPPRSSSIPASSATKSTSKSVRPPTTTPSSSSSSSSSSSLSSTAATSGVRAAVPPPVPSETKRVRGGIPPRKVTRPRKGKVTKRGGKKMKKEEDSVVGKETGRESEGKLDIEVEEEEGDGKDMLERSPARKSDLERSKSKSPLAQGHGHVARGSARVPVVAQYPEPHLVGGDLDMTGGSLSHESIHSHHSHTSHPSSSPPPLSSSAASQSVEFDARQWEENDGDDYVQGSGDGAEKHRDAPWHTATENIHVDPVTLGDEEEEGDEGFEEEEDGVGGSGEEEDEEEMKQLQEELGEMWPGGQRARRDEDAPAPVPRGAPRSWTHGAPDTTFLGMTAGASPAHSIERGTRVSPAPIPVQPPTPQRVVPASGNEGYGEESEAVMEVAGVESIRTGGRSGSGGGKAGVLGGPLADPAIQPTWESEHVRSRLHAESSRAVSLLAPQSFLKRSTIVGISPLPQGVSRSAQGALAWDAAGDSVVFGAGSTVVALGVREDDDGVSDGGGPDLSLKPRFTPRSQRHFVGHDGVVRLVALDPRGGALLASVSSPSATAAATTTATRANAGPKIRLWSYYAGRCLADLAAPERGCFALSFSHDGSELAVAGADRRGNPCILVWDVSNALEQARADSASKPEPPFAPLRPPLRRPGSEAGVRGSMLGLGPNDLGVACPIVAHQSSDFSLVRVSFSPFERHKLVACGRENVRFLRVARGHLPSTSVVLNEHARGNVFLDVAFYEHATPTPTPTSPSSTSHETAAAPAELVSSVIPSTPKGARKVFVSSSNGCVLQIGYESRLLEAVFPTHAGPCVALSAAAGVCATGGADACVRVWPLDFTDFALEARHPTAVVASSMSSDGLRIAAVDAHGTVGVLDLASQAHHTLTRPHVGAVHAVAVRPAVRVFPTEHVVWTRSAGRVAAPRDAGLGETDRGGRRAPPPRPGHMDPCEFATASADGSVRVWDAKTIEPRFEFRSIDSSSSSSSSSSSPSTPAPQPTALAFRPLAAIPEFAARSVGGAIAAAQEGLLVDAGAAREWLVSLQLGASDGGETGADEEAKDAEEGSDEEEGDESLSRAEREAKTERERARARALRKRKEAVDEKAAEIALAEAAIYEHELAVGFSDGKIRVFHIPSAKARKEWQPHVGNVAAIKYAGLVGAEMGMRASMAATRAGALVPAAPAVPGGSSPLVLVSLGFDGVLAIADVLRDYTPLRTLAASVPPSVKLTNASLDAGCTAEGKSLLAVALTGLHAKGEHEVDEEELAKGVFASEKWSRTVVLDLRNFHTVSQLRMTKSPPQEAIEAAALLLDAAVASDETRTPHPSTTTSSTSASSASRSPGRHKSVTSPPPSPSRVPTSNGVGGVAFVDGARHVCAWTEDWRLARFDAEIGGKPLQELRGAHQGGVTALAAASRAAIVATTGADGKVRVWDATLSGPPDSAPTLRELKTHLGPVLAAQWLADGKNLVAAGEDGTMVVVRVNAAIEHGDSKGIGWNESAPFVLPAPDVRALAGLAPMDDDIEEDEEDAIERMRPHGRAAAEEAAAIAKSRHDDLGADLFSDIGLGGVAAEDALETLATRLQRPDLQQNRSRPSAEPRRLPSSSSTDPSTAMTATAPATSDSKSAEDESEELPSWVTRLPSLDGHGRMSGKCVRLIPHRFVSLAVGAWGSVVWSRDSGLLLTAGQTWVTVDDLSAPEAPPIRLDPIVCLRSPQAVDALAPMGIPHVSALAAGQLAKTSGTLEWVVIGVSPSDASERAMNVDLPLPASLAPGAGAASSRPPPSDPLPSDRITLPSFPAATVFARVWDATAERFGARSVGTLAFPSPSAGTGRPPAHVGRRAKIQVVSGLAGRLRSLVLSPDGRYAVAVADAASLAVVSVQQVAPSLSSGSTTDSTDDDSPFAVRDRGEPIVTRVPAIAWGLGLIAVWDLSELLRSEEESGESGGVLGRPVAFRLLGNEAVVSSTATRRALQKASEVTKPLSPMTMHRATSTTTSSRRRKKKRMPPPLVHGVRFCSERGFVCVGSLGLLHGRITTDSELESTRGDGMTLSTVIHPESILAALGQAGNMDDETGSVGSAGSITSTGSSSVTGMGSSKGPRLGSVAVVPSGVHAGLIAVSDTEGGVWFARAVEGRVEVLGREDRPLWGASRERSTVPLSSLHSAQKPSCPLLAWGAPDDRGLPTLLGGREDGRVALWELETDEAHVSDSGSGSGSAVAMFGGMLHRPTSRSETAMATDGSVVPRLALRAYHVLDDQITWMDWDAAPQVPGKRAGHGAAKDIVGGGTGLAVTAGGSVWMVGWSDANPPQRVAAAHGGPVQTLVAGGIAAPPPVDGADEPFGPWRADPIVGVVATVAQPSPPTELPDARKVLSTADAGVRVWNAPVWEPIVRLTPSDAATSPGSRAWALRARPSALAIASSGVFHTDDDDEEEEDEEEVEMEEEMLMGGDDGFGVRFGEERGGGGEGRGGSVDSSSLDLGREFTGGIAPPPAGRLAVGFPDGSVQVVRVSGMRREARLVVAGSSCVTALSWGAGLVPWPACPPDREYPSYGVLFAGSQDGSVTVIPYTPTAFDPSEENGSGAKKKKPEPPAFGRARVLRDQAKREEAILQAKRLLPPSVCALSDLADTPHARAAAAKHASSPIVSIDASPRHPCRFALASANGFVSVWELDVVGVLPPSHTGSPRKRRQRQLSLRARLLAAFATESRTATTRVAWSPALEDVVFVCAALQNPGSVPASDGGAPPLARGALWAYNVGRRKWLASRPLGHAPTSLSRLPPSQPVAPRSIAIPGVAGDEPYEDPRAGMPRVSDDLGVSSAGAMLLGTEAGTIEVCRAARLHQGSVETSGSADPGLGCRIGDIVALATATPNVPIDAVAYVPPSFDGDPGRIVAAADTSLCSWQL